MSNLTTALAIVLSISAMLILGGMVASDIAGSDKTLMSCKGTMFDNDNCNNYTLNTGGLGNSLPNTNINVVTPTGITGEEGIFANIGAWLSDITGISYVYNIVTAPVTFFKIVFGNGKNMSMYADVFATIWYFLTLFLLISWWKGQDS